MITKETKVFDALNLYLNNKRHSKLKEYYHNIYNDYLANGGTKPLSYFEKNIDYYNYDGYYGA